MCAMSRRALLQDSVAQGLVEVRHIRSIERAARRVGQPSAVSRQRSAPMAPEDVVATLCYLGCSADDTLRVHAVYTNTFAPSSARGGARRARVHLEETRPPVLLARGEACWQTQGRSRLGLRLSLLVSERRVVQWLAAANLRGVAASREQLVEQLRAGWPALGRSGRSLTFLLRLRHSACAATKWAWRFRRRWSVVWRRLPARSGLSREELSAKARSY
jgi:hypothetical protein